MEILNYLLEETLRVYVGLVGLFILYAIGINLSKVIEGLVKWIENRINAIRKTYSLHK